MERDQPSPEHERRHEGRALGPWFHVERLPEPGGRAALAAAEARHAAGARRLRDGDPIVLFDGAGGLAQAILAQRGRAAEVQEVWSAERRPARVILAAALPKGDRSATMVDMATQLGADEVVPLAAEHRVAEATPSLLGRLRRVALEACKQSRRAWLPEVREECTPSEALAHAQRASRGEGARLLALVADPDGAPLGLELARHEGDGARPDRVLILVGPEAGFTRAEVGAMTDAGGRPVRLGAGLLRIETAAAAALAVVGAWLDPRQ